VRSRPTPAAGRSPAAASTRVATTRSKPTPSPKTPEPLTPEPLTPEPLRPERQLLGEGREAEIFAWGEGQVLRLYRNAASAPRLARERLALSAARSAGLPVPEVFEQLEVDGRPALVMERVDGQDQLTVLSAKPWKALAIASKLGALQAKVHQEPAPGSLPAMREVLRQRIELAQGFGLSLDLASFALATLHALPDGDRLCHGDFHPGNLLVGDGGPTIIDWTNATCGDPLGDVARAWVILRLGSVPEGSSPLLQRVEQAGRGVFVSSYLRAYRRRRPIDNTLLDQWTVSHAAGRVAENIDGELEPLTGFLNARRR
jgi:aminoglycoside phosphotransferase (APT) family kinase protein